MHKTILFEETARAAMFRGLTKAARAVISTFGPNGRTALLDREDGILITKDGITVLDTIELKDSTEDLAVQLLQDASRRTNDEVGDGTTSTVLYAYVLARELNRYVVAGHSPNNLNRIVERCEEIIQHLLTSTDEYGDSYMAVPVDGEQDIRDLALVASNGDVQIADLLSEVFINIGQDGTIVLEDDDTLGKTHVVYDEGLVLPKGFVNSHFVNTDMGTCVLDDCKVLICTDRLYGADQIKQIVTEVARKREKLLVIAGDICEEAEQLLILNNQPNKEGVVTLRSCAIRAPGGGGRQVEVMRDVAAACGATVVGVHTGFPVNTMNYKDLGTLKKATIKQNSSILIGYDKHSEALQNRIAELNRALDKIGDDYERERLKERVARMVGAIARIKVGAPTEIEQKALKGAIEDGVFTVQAGISSGIVAAAGRTAWELADSLEDNYKACFEVEELTDVEKAAIDAVKTTLYAPAKCIVCRTDAFRERVYRAYSLGRAPLGFNAQTEEIVDLWRHGIVEPAAVVSHSIRNGFSAGRLIATGDCAITNSRVVDGLTDVQRASRLWSRNWRHY